MIKFVAFGGKMLLDKTFQKGLKAPKSLVRLNYKKINKLQYCRNINVKKWFQIEPRFRTAVVEDKR